MFVLGTRERGKELVDGSCKHCLCAPDQVKPVSPLLIRDSYVYHVIAGHVPFPRDYLKKKTVALKDF